MATLRDIKRRIKAVESTSKITKAMKMVAAAKFRKAQQRMLEMRPYAERMNSIDVVGRKARDYYKRRGIELRKAWTGIAGKISYANAQEIAAQIIENYTNETTDEVLLIFNEFKSAIAQQVMITRLLPLAPIEAAEETLPIYNFIYEPSKQEIFSRLVPKNVEIQIFRALLESQASEEAARMAAMENATKAANDMIDSLTLQFNKARQASITKELMDIVGGVEAMKG
jgi:F-type H+-transporting ATPase subunit gamma